MAKDPAFLFYPGDWLGGTMGMTLEQKGAYFELLVFQFNNGPFTEAQAKLVLSMCDASVWLVVCKKFAQEDGKYFNKRLAAEMSKRQKFTESRRNNANKRKNKENEQSICSALGEHMENENENRIENDLGKRVQGENQSDGITQVSLEQELITAFDEITMESYALQFKNVDLTEALSEFKLKVRNAEANYIGHGVPGLRSAFQHHLRSIRTRAPDLGKKSKSEIMDQVRKLQQQ